MNLAESKTMHLSGKSPMDRQAHACNCSGPQPGMPACPCRMRGMTQVDGRWVEVIDHGAVKTWGAAGLPTHYTVRGVS